MNKSRRKWIENVADRVDDIQTDMQSIADEEREYFENMPENLQDSDKGINADQAADELEDIVSELEDLVDRIRSVSENF